MANSGRASAHGLRGRAAAGALVLGLAAWLGACGNADGEGGPVPAADGAKLAPDVALEELPDAAPDAVPDTSAAEVGDAAGADQAVDIALACSPVDCDDGNLCTSDACKDGACTHLPSSATCSDGDACTVGDLCKNSVCLPGQITNCEDGSVCTVDSCNPASGCQHAAKPGDCSDGDDCTVNDACKGGTCQSGVNICDDGNPCTKDTCKQGGGCLSTAASAPCQDGNPCTADDQCAAGVCLPGTPTDCSDGNLCTNDSCDSKLGGCQHANNTLPCDDGDSCTLGDKCAGGACAFGKKIPCNDGNLCTDDACDGQGLCAPKNNVGGACQDGNGCTTGDKCGGGVCLAGAVTDCNDGNVCTVDYCDFSKGCINLQVPMLCDDGSACTTNDVCSGGACGGKTKVCDDGNPCSDDGCDKASGCVALANSASCTDGDACSVDDKCANKACQPGVAKSCNDANPCTDDVCDKATGCANAANSKACNDGNSCTQGDSCANGLCKAGAAKDCQDGNPCTTDSCDSAGGCVALPNTQTCTDGSACTVGDKCVAGACLPGTATTCDDANVCTTDGCDSAKGCVNSAKSGVLPTCDGSVWNGHCYKKFATPLDWPAAEAACVKWGGHLTSIASPEENAMLQQSGNAGWIGANDLATENKFEWSDGSPFGYKGWRAGEPNDAAEEDCAELEGTGAWNDSSCEGAKPYVCERDPPTDCTDGNPCTEGDKCANSACTAGPAKFCGDGNPCTDDACTVSTGTCAWIANTATCTDKNVCTVGDKCANSTCAAGALKTCSDNNTCTTDVCHPLKDCVFPFDAGGDPTSCDGTLANGRCYKAVATKVTWKQAESDCVAWGGHLASIGSSQEHNTLQLLGKEGWIGATDTEQEGTWIWADGTPYAFNQWDQGSLQMAAQIDDWDCAWFLMTWRIDQCNDLKSYICERGPPPTCNDNSACTTADKCVAGQCAGSAVNCNDGNACTVDSCAPTGGCKAVALADGVTCSGGGVCTAGSCKLAVCGNGKVEGSEQCDDGNNANADGCGSVCAQELGWACSGGPSTCATLCGDGIKAGKEQCDDSNNGNGDGCSATCTSESNCSNATKDGTETDVDCGGSGCGACGTGKNCAVNADCLSKACTPAGLCAVAVPCGNTSGLQASSPFPMAGMCLTQTGLAKVVGPHKPTVAKAYQLTATSNAGFYGAAAIGADGTLYAPGQDGQLYAVKQDGTVLWKFATGDIAHYVTPALGANGTVYVGTVAGGLHAIHSATGQAKWTFTAGGSLGGSPTIDPNGTVYIGCDDAKLYAVKADGNLAWTYTTGGPFVRGSPAIASDGTVYIGSYDKKLHAIKADGSPKWQFLTGSQITTSPVLDGDGTVYVAPGDGKVHVIAPDGKAKGAAWAASSSGALAFGPDGTLYDGTMDGMLYAFAPGGTRLWGVKLTGGVQPVGPPIVGADGLIYLATGSGSVFAHVPTTGAQKWTLKPGGQLYANLAMAADGTLWIGDPIGSLFALRDAATCSNGSKDGSETDSDCGGANCKTCAVGKGCSAGTDCQSGVCSGTCQAPKCGDGAVQAYEQCDDGNGVNGDGCAATCLVESQYACSGSPSVCALATKCTNNPCKNGGTCTGDATSYSCNCATGWGGINCDKNIMGNWVPGAALTSARTQHNLVLLADGRVLAVGGLDQNIPQASANLLDPTKNTVTPAANSMTGGARSRMASARLTDGRVLVAFGIANNVVVGNYHLFDPATNQFNAATNAPGRVNHTVTALDDGRALIVGGAGQSSGGSPFAEALIINPTTLNATSVSIGPARHSHAALKLANGKVLVAVGSGVSGALTNGFLFNPANNSVTATKAVLTAHAAEAVITQLGNGKVLISGDTASVDVYDPVADTVQVVPTGMAARWNHSTSLLKDGRVLLAGGQTSSATILDTSILYDPASNSCKAGPNLPSPRRAHGAVTLDDGRVLVFGGASGATATASSSSALFVPASNAFANVPNTMSTARSQVYGIKLNDGRVWVAGGYSGTSGGYLTATDFFQ